MHSVSSMQEATRASNKAFQITLTLQQAKPPPQARSHLPESISQLCALPCASQRWHRRAGRERRTMARTHRAGIGWECPLCARAPAVQLGTDTAGYRQNAARGLCARAQQGDHTCAMHPRTTTCTSYSASADDQYREVPCLNPNSTMRTARDPARDLRYRSVSSLRV